ncbi:hypothetical protein QBC36DRAFT_56906 [Triangularia setosa]|uniref:DUF3824 domain-containing protein n=1 Tax=Triangularia setosa TaxID=2587417 RepID=A0AAN6WDA4_9PEZI|nr:hypothetical protein QBC36DRAFT_56906 [Podospora setosa]
MPEVYRESRYTRDTSPSDDEGYKRTTVRRYKVGPVSVEKSDRIERERERDVEVIEEDRRSRYGGGSRVGRDREDHIEVDRRVERVYIPERPRSAFEPSPHSGTYVERREVIEREREREPRDDFIRVDRTEYRDRGGDRDTVVERERIIERERDDRDYDRTRTVVERQVVERDDRNEYWRQDVTDRPKVVYESKELQRVERDRDDAFSPRTPRDWDRRSYWDEDKQTEVRVERRVERRDSHGGEVVVERRIEERDHRDDDRYSGEIERWRKETEYYEPIVQPAPVPIVIRQRAPEQRIIVQEAPPPPPVVIREQAQETNVAIARIPARDEEYYYRRESREVAPYRGERREEEYEVERYGDPHRHHHHHHHSHSRHSHRHDGYSDAESDGEFYVRRRIVKREESSSPHRKRHIAEGALAGAGISAILASRRNANGELPEKRGRKVLAGAALGAIGTEVARRAHSAYEDRYGEKEKEVIIRERSRSRHGRSRSRSRSPHSRLKTGLGIAAVALAAAGAAKLYQSNKVEKEEMARGRPVHRASSDSSRSPSRKRSKSAAAKAGLGTAAAVGLVQHYRHKRSKSRDGKSRSRSRLRTGAEMVAAGLAAAGAKKMYDKRQDKKEDEREKEALKRERELSDDEHYARDEESYRRRSRSRSLPRSGPTYPDDDLPPTDPELGMVEYGEHPLYANPARPHDPYGAAMGPAAAAAGYESAAEEGRHRGRRKRSHRRRSRGDDDDYSADSEPETDKEKKRSSSKLRDLAAGAAAAGAAAFGIKKVRDNKKEKEKEKERDKDERDRERDREKDRDRDRSRRDRDGDRDRERDRDRDRSRDRSRNRSRDRSHDRDVERKRERERSRGKERDQRRYDDEDSYRRTPSPAHASGGYWQPPPPPQPVVNNGFTNHPNYVSDNLHQQQYQPYRPADYPGFSPPPPGVPPNSAATNNGMPPGPPHQMPPPPAPQVPPPNQPPGPEHVSNEASHVVGRSIPATAAAAAAAYAATVAASPRPNVEGDKKDGLNTKLTPFYSPPTSPIMTPQTEDDDPNDDMPGTPRTARSVIFIPMSPKSQATLRRHREAQDAARSGAEDSDITPPSPLEITSSDDDKSSRKKTKDRKVASETDDESAVEELPDRFDGEGRPLTAQGHEDRRGGVHSRKGSFEYRSPKGAQGLNMMGDWAVSGADKETVEKIVQNVTGVLEGRGSWMGLIGGLLSGNLLQGGGGHGEEGGHDGSGRGSRERDRDRKGKSRGHDRSEDEGDDEEDDRYRGWRRSGRRKTEDERGESSRHATDRKKGRHDAHDYDDDDDYHADEDRKRRRRRHRERDDESDRQRYR